MRTLLLLAGALTLAACSSTPDGPVTEDGRLENGDATLTSGEFQDTHSVQLNEGQWLRVTLRSTDFDPYLIVRFPNRQQSDRDDSTPGDTTSVSMALRAEESGTYEILVTTYRPGATGAYTLTYEVSDTELTVPEGSASTAPATDDETMDDEAPADEPMPDDGDASGNAIRSLDDGDGDAPADRTPADDAPADGGDDKTLDA